MKTKFIIFLILIAVNITQAEVKHGLIENFETLIQSHEEVYEKEKIKAPLNLKILEGINEKTNLQLSENFIKSILYNSNEAFLKILQKDECQFYNGIENNLLKNSNNENDVLIATIKTSDEKFENIKISYSDFFKNIKKYKCLKNDDYNKIFDDKNFKQTISNLKLEIPKNIIQCREILTQWQKNNYTPHLCKILKNDSTKNQLESFTKNYLSNLCTNLFNESGFCKNYLKNDVWNEVINGASPNYKLSYICQDVTFKNTPVNENDLKNCSLKLNYNPKLCETIPNRVFTAFYPSQSCDLLSETLKKTKLITKYNDCPGNIDNESLSNAYRITNHFQGNEIISNASNCANEASNTLAKLNKAIKNEEAWPLKICFKNRVHEKEMCTPYIPGDQASEALSESKVIAKILYQNKGASPKTSCRIVDNKTYNPLRSEFKFGCFIVFNKENCTNLECNKKIIWEEKELTDITYRGQLTFDYFPTSFKNDRLSLNNMLNEALKTEQKSIKDLTFLKYFLDSNPTSIIHGVGCIEDLMPEFFKRLSLNQCRPMPFIIDGYKIINDEILLTFRSAIDGVHRPQFINWYNVFNAISSYQNIHPLNTWTLYGIKK